MVYIILYFIEFAVKFKHFSKIYLQFSLLLSNNAPVGTIIFILYQQYFIQQQHSRLYFLSNVKNLN